jgi:hypothetical protein
MCVKKMVFVWMFLTGTMLWASERPLLATAAAAPACRAARLVSADFLNDFKQFAKPVGCEDCAARCAGVIDECKQGGQAACYKAAACLCQCNFDEGGCGIDKEALQKCVDDNLAAAKKVE